MCEIVITNIIAGIALFISVANAIYSWVRNHYKKIDFWAEIIYTNEEKDGADRPNKEGEIQKGSRIEMHIVNRGCPITILGIYFDQTPTKTFKIHLDSFPARLENGSVLKVQEPFPFPVNREKIEDNNVPFYLIDSSEKRYEMKKIYRIASPSQVHISRLNPDKNRDSNK